MKLIIAKIIIIMVKCWAGVGCVSSGRQEGVVVTCHRHTSEEADNGVLLFLIY